MYQTLCSPSKFAIFGGILCEAVGEPTTPYDVGNIDWKSNVQALTNNNTATLKVDTQVNVGDFQEKITNETAYEDLLAYMTTNAVMDIPPIDYGKIRAMLTYRITDAYGNIVDEGVHINPMVMCERTYLMNSTEDNKLQYRKAISGKCSFVIDRFRKPAYNVSANTITTTLYLNRNSYEDELRFSILNIQLVTDDMRCPGKKIPPSSMDANLKPYYNTVQNLIQDAVVVFDSASEYDIDFGTHVIPSKVCTVLTTMEVALPVVNVVNTAEIEDLAFRNASEYYPPEDGSNGTTVPPAFNPLPNRPPCPGVLPHDFNKYWARPFPGCQNPGHSPHYYPLVPGPDRPEETTKIDPKNLTGTELPGMYDLSGRMLRSWAVLKSTEAIDVFDDGSMAVLKPELLSGIFIVDKEVTGFMNKTFMGCFALHTIVVPETVTEIPEFFAYMVSGLKRVILPTTITTIHNSAFQHCENLVEITLPEKLETVEEKAFSHTKMLSITVPTGITTVGENAFEETFEVTYLGDLDTATWGANSYVLKEAEEEVPPVEENPETPDAGGEDTGTTTDPTDPTDPENPTDPTDPENPDTPVG